MKNNQTAKKYLLLITATIALAALAACGGSNNTTTPDPDVNNGTAYSVSLSANQEVPAAASTGTGAGSVTLDESNGDIDATITMTGLTSTITAAHVHSGEAGLNGGVVITLEEGADNNTWKIPAGTGLDSSQMAAFLAGTMYFNVHTMSIGSGEVRGQIIPTGITVIRTALDGDHETPPIATNGTAVGYITINNATRAISANVRTTNVAGADAAHIHSGFAGADGGVISAFTQDASDVDLWQLSDVLDAAELAELNAGGTYYNVHNPTYTAGVVRGQIAPDAITVVRSTLDGDQEDPPVISTGSGIGYTTVNTSTGAVTANIRTSGLAGTETAAHIHQGATGMSGGVIVPFAQADMADTTFWTADDTLDAAALALFNAGNLYFNLHTTTNLGGEIRGQITP